MDDFDTIPYEIACQNDGIWSKSENSLDIMTQMNQYYFYFAYLRNDPKPVWVEPYEDINEVGEVYLFFFFFFLPKLKMNFYPKLNNR